VQDGINPILGYLGYSVKRQRLKPLHSQNHRKLCALLKRQRVEQELTQAMLAAKLDVPQSFISKIEAGERRLDVLELRQVCSAMGVSFRGFVQRLEDELL
jgi:DNA-binding XRE family transcriptional regulator